MALLLQCLQNLRAQQGEYDTVFQEDPTPARGWGNGAKFVAFTGRKSGHQRGAVFWKGTKLLSLTLALHAGLPVDNGIIVDATLRTVDLQVSAIGDVASFPGRDGGQRLRLELVQNAANQARAVAARLAGRVTGPYQAVPWFWSDQGDLQLQIAGQHGDHDERVVIGDAAANNFSVLCISAGMLREVESVNRPGDHVLARRLLAKQTRVFPAQAREPGFTLKML